ncbi:glycosyltransferase [Namhaeicola litoreus]|uniref:Glycosyltransferase n=1 Tax=Namhaeicola litoreus TaxID=1052145 RepID=A0ABW3Y162_9FLAO
MKRILVAPLNWGLGHATRCIPVVGALLEQGFEPVLASDGQALELLKKEFPALVSIELPSYHIKYTKNGNLLALGLLGQSQKIRRAAEKEYNCVDKLVAELKLDGIISDNRFGVYSKKVPSVYITHQLNVPFGVFTRMASKIHHKLISKFDECWVPDYEGYDNLAGSLSFPPPKKIQIRYIKPLSRFDYKAFVKVYDILVIISGPEPQRSIFEEKMIEKFKEFDGKVLIVRGILEQDQKREFLDSIEIVNYMLKEELEAAILRSELIISRSGYTTIMDMEALRSKAFFIPTPGQFEQILLAIHLRKRGIANFSFQKNFTLCKLKEGLQTQGFPIKKTSNENAEMLSFDVFNS